MKTQYLFVNLDNLQLNCSEVLITIHVDMVLFDNN